METFDLWDKVFLAGVVGTFLVFGVTVAWATWESRGKH